MDPSAHLEKIAQRVAARVSPTPAESAREKQFTQKLLAAFSKALPHATLHLVGSTARDTGMAGEQDIDVFAAFDRELDEDAIVQKTVAACKNTFPKAGWEMHYAEHPYLQGRMDAYQVEVIPCYRTEKGQKIKSAVDRTPLHMDFLQKQLSASQRQDVRALKRLLKTHGLYGAELRIKGFSGLLCEYLVLNYRSFAGLIDAARQWKPQIYIDMVHPAAPVGKNQARTTANGGHSQNAAVHKTSGPAPNSPATTFDTPLVLIDAVDEQRNVAAVVSQTQLYRFIALCQSLWRKPDERRFFPQMKKAMKATALTNALQGRGMDWHILQMKKPAIVDDIAWPQLERTAANVRKQLELHGFSVFSCHAFDDPTHAYLLLELPCARLPPLRRTQGPSAIHDAAVRQFIAGKKPLHGPYIEGNRVWVEEKRDLTDAWALLRQIQKRPERYGIASHFQKPFKAARFIKPTQLGPDAARQLSHLLIGNDSVL